MKASTIIQGKDLLPPTSLEELMLINSLIRIDQLEATIEKLRTNISELDLIINTLAKKVHLDKLTRSDGLCITFDYIYSDYNSEEFELVKKYLVKEENENE